MFSRQHERRVTLVDVPDGRTVAEAFQGAQPADAQNDLLQDARLVVSSVKARGDLAVLGAVLRNVRVQEKQRNPSHLDQTNQDEDRPVADLDRDDRRTAVGRLRKTDRKTVDVQNGILLALPFERVERLAKVALAVEEADPDERDPEVARRLQVIARPGRRVLRRRPAEAPSIRTRPRSRRCGLLGKPVPGPPDCARECRLPPRARRRSRRAARESRRPATAHPASRPARGAALRRDFLPSRTRPRDRSIQTAPAASGAMSSASSARAVGGAGGVPEGAGAGVGQLASTPTDNNICTGRSAAN